MTSSISELIYDSSAYINLKSMEHRCIYFAELRVSEKSHMFELPCSSHIPLSNMLALSPESLFLDVRWEMIMESLSVPHCAKGASDIKAIRKTQTKISRHVNPVTGMSNAGGEPNIAVSESCKLVLLLAFKMSLRNATRKASPFSQLSLNPYLTVLLTFLPLF